jgi:hydrogenase maturation factor HypE
MRAFIERVFKSKKQKQKELIDEITHTEVENQATEAVVEAIIKEVKEEVKKEEVVTYPKPNHFPDCNCFKCDKWKQQNAK